MLKSVYNLHQKRTSNWISVTIEPIKIITNFN